MSGSLDAQLHSLDTRQTYMANKVEEIKVEEPVEAAKAEEPQLVLKTKKCHKSKKDKKAKVVSESEDSSDADSESSGSSSEDEKPKKSKRRKSKKVESGSETSESDSEPEQRSRRRRRKSESSDESDADDSLEELRQQIASLSEKLDEKVAAKESSTKSSNKKSRRKARRQKMAESSSKKSSDKDDSNFKRVDQLWDDSIHNYKLKESEEQDDSEFAEYAFLVRRRFDWENKYLCTVVDIKAKDLRDALAVVMKDCKSVSMEAEEPTIDPNLLFLYLDEIKAHTKTLKSKIKKERKKKIIKKLKTQRELCKTLIAYVNEDYKETKKTLVPLLAAGNITFDLIWALFKPGDIALTSTYGVWDEPRCFKMESAHKYNSLAKGEYYELSGQYLEYDGKAFGYGEFESEIESFKGPRKIASLGTFPLKYHKDPDSIRKALVARGRRFVDVAGMNYRLHKGLAFAKRKKAILRINVNGRVMVDPGTFRRINPNYQVSTIKAKDADELFDDNSDEECSCCSSSDSDTPKVENLKKKTEDDEPKVMYKYVEDTEDGGYVKVAVEVDENGDPIRNQKVEQLSAATSFTEDDLLLTSSVVLGFAFSEKLWLEFTLSGIKEIQYNEKAFESLVLPPNQKSIVKALVESHKFNAAKTIDDVIQGKGKGLVSVLHGPPGVGKTLTAESISELLKCPLYTVSAGELGTEPARLETELQKILDIAHSWGAVLLLDEADVFLEKRETHDIHRNALVSIFLRLLEYYCGVLILTTNRVETFDEAFQSRIHIALRYGELGTKAKKTIWTMFLDLCRKSGGCEVASFSEHELDALSRHQLNGRQIKNIVRTAQALALNEKVTLDMEHIKRVLEVAETFDRDLKGGTGYIDAMRSYT